MYVLKCSYLTKFVSKAEKHWLCKVNRRGLTWDYLTNEKNYSKFHLRLWGWLTVQICLSKIGSDWCIWNRTNPVSDWCHLFVSTTQYFNNIYILNVLEITHTQKYYTARESQSKLTQFLNSFLYLYLYLIMFPSMKYWGTFNIDYHHEDLYLTLECLLWQFQSHIYDYYYFEEDAAEVEWLLRSQPVLFGIESLPLKVSWQNAKPQESSHWLYDVWLSVPEVQEAHLFPTESLFWQFMWR